jgi:Zn-finger nucleic acid-binding protein
MLLTAALLVLRPLFREPAARIDPRAGTLVSGLGPGAWFRRVTRPLRDIQAITLNRDICVNQWTKGYHDLYSTSAVVQGGAVLLCTARSYLAGRRRSESAANALQVPMRDASFGPEVTREPGFLDEPIQARLRRLGLKYLPPPARPVSDDADVREAVTPERVVIEHDVGRFTVAGVVGILVCLGYGFLGLLPFLASDSAVHDPAMRDGMIVILTLVVYLPAAVLLGVILHAVSRHTRVVLSQDGLRVTTRILGIPWPRTIPLHELEELVKVDAELSLLPLHSTVVAHSDRRTLSFLRGASWVEVDRGLAHLLAWLTRDQDLATSEVIPFVSRLTEPLTPVTSNGQAPPAAYDADLVGPKPSSPVNWNPDVASDDMLGGPLCPRCQPPPPLEDGTTSLGDKRCPRCHGMLLERGGTETLLFRQMGLTPDLVREIAKLFAGRRVPCPACRRPMTVLRVKGRVVDLCQGCGATWLDATELESISQGLHAEKPDT